MPAFNALTGLVRRLLMPSSKGAPSVDVERLGYLLGVHPAVLMVFRGPKQSPYTYRPLQRSKRDGSMRQIYAPSAQLKTVQHALLHNYLDGLQAHKAAIGFQRGLSIAVNAQLHQGYAVTATADIANFFDNTSAQRVREFFRAQGWDDTATAILTGLCTFRGTLPQGAPTSPALSNLVNIELDKSLESLAQRSNAQYTRYGDDLTFSWQNERAVPRGMHTDVQRRLLEFGYSLNPTKGWRVWRVNRGEEPIITGVRLGRDKKLHPSPEVEEAIRQLKKRRNDEDAQAQLQGYEGFLRMLE
ncbi:MAG: RNA-directed DNA polymerase [Anaerolineae bacterium]|nr:RNA-directed DNA polymerase [Anaerolineae bacterium]